LAEANDDEEEDDKLDEEVEGATKESEEVWCTERAEVV